MILELACALANQQTIPAQESSTIRMDVNLDRRACRRDESRGPIRAGTHQAGFSIVHR